MAQKKPAALLIERLAGSMKEGATLQLVACSATVDASMRRQLGEALGGAGKKAAGVVVTADPAHKAPAHLKRRGVAGVTMPSTITHIAYAGREAAKLKMLQVAFEERSPRAPLLVLPNGASLPAEVRALKRVGFSGAIALHDALGVPSRAGGATSATAAAAAAAADPADASAQEGMLERRQALADTFVRNMRSDGAAAAAKPAAEADEDEDEEDDDDGFEDAVGETSELGVPLLVTTELAARGVDFKAIDVVFMLGLPTRLDSYVHVAGRTAREGRKGHAISLLTSPQQEERFAQYKSELGLKAEVIDLRFLS